MIELSEKMIGKKVKSLYEGGICSRFIPKKGTVGVIQHYESDGYWVKWDKGSVQANLGDRSWVLSSLLELVENDTLISDKEIWEMLKPKMEKNGLYPCEHPWGNEYYYNPEDFHKAVAIAYRSGFERSTKGRPFQFTNKVDKEGNNEN